MANDEITAAMLREIPDNGSWLRKVRRWNVRNGFVITHLLWLGALVLILRWCLT